MPRELLKFRDGDVGMKIRKDGALELAGVGGDEGMIRKDGMVNPAMLFAAAWARRDQKVFELLIENFKSAILEGYFGEPAKADYQKALELKEKADKESPQDLNTPLPTSMKEIPIPPEKEIPATTDTASGAVTFEQPKPLTSEEAVTRRDSK